MAQETRILLGTTKGAFILRRSGSGGAWRVSGPFCDGATINHVVGDPGSGMIWAAGSSYWHGTGVWRSADGGDSWMLSTKGIAAEEGEQGPESLWSLGLHGGKLYAGAKPAALYESSDAGDTWTKLSGLTDHPSRPNWHPGAAGLVLHTIVGSGDPRKFWVGISAVGTFATEDGGVTWELRNRSDNDPSVDLGHFHDDGEIGSCVHNIGRAPGSGDLLYQQNHHGVFRSQDGGRTWNSISAGLPSTFGFPVGVHRHDPQTLWVFPLNGDSAGRFPPEASAAVWRSRNGGGTWEKLQNGLPVQDCFFTVLRQAMAVDGGKQAGVYFGTNSGSVFASADEGDHWTEIARHLPTILSVEVMEAA
jgi:hypothetical protein